MLDKFTEYRDIPYEEHIEIEHGNIRTFEVFISKDRQLMEDLQGFELLLVDDSPDLAETNDYIFKVHDLTYLSLQIKEDRLLVIIDTTLQTTSNNGELEYVYKKGHRYTLKLRKDNLIFLIFHIAVL